MAKFCRACGNALEENDTICKTCGKEVINEQPVQQAQQQPQVTVINNNAPVAKSNGMATAGFVLSLVSLLCCGGTSVIALIFSIIGLVNAKKCNDNGKGMAIAGIIISAILILGSILVTIMYTIGAVSISTASFDSSSIFR